MRFTSATKSCARVDDRVIAAVGARKLGLFLASDGADDGRSERLGPLADDQPDAAGRGVNEDRVARLDRGGPRAEASAR